MPSLHPDSSDSPLPSARPSRSDAARPLPGTSSRSLRWRIHGALFAATMASVFVTLFLLEREAGESTRTAVREAGEFMAALLAILLAHEFGHYVAARLHRVDASLPYFIPLPLLSPFGTMGAVIRMRSPIPSRRALLDIGAAGPLAGLALAIPLYAWGTAHSALVAVGGEGGQLGTSLLLQWLDRTFAPAVPEGMDLELSPVAYAAWAGMFVTMINLLPAGQLDGAHVSYALFGPRQNQIAKWVHRSMLAFFFVSVASFVARDLRAGLGLWHLGRDVYNSLFWLVLFETLAILGAVVSRGGPEGGADLLPVRVRIVPLVGLALVGHALCDHRTVLLWIAFATALVGLIGMEARWGALRSDSRSLDHPPTGTASLPLGRALVAVVTLAFFALLFMPAPFVF